MATLRVKRADAVIFQVVRKNLAGRDEAARQWKEVRVHTLAVKPASIQYIEGSRSTITQTSPDAGFVDRFGSRLIRVNMTGTFGLQPRRQGLSIKDGYTRLLDFRDDVFRLSQRARQEKDDANTHYVYAVNFYDFINDEKFAINLDQFSRTLDARRNAFEPTYDLSFTSIGDTFKGIISKDPLLLALNAMDAAFDAAESAIDDFLENTTIGEYLGYASGAVEAVEALTGTAAGLAGLAAAYAGTIAGEVTVLGFGTNQSSQAVSKIANILSVKG